jgi:hypothetical protein
LEYVALIIACFTALICLTQLNRLQQRVEKQGKTTDTDQRLAKILALYDNIEGLMDSFEHYVEEMRQELERERGHMTELSRQAAVLYSKSSAPNHSPEPPPELPKELEQNGGPVPNGAPIPGKAKRTSRLTDSDIRKLDEMTTKQQKVRFLMSRGLSLEEVARELNIGKGEVRLIADLDKT